MEVNLSLDEVDNRRRKGKEGKSLISENRKGWKET